MSQTTPSARAPASPTSITPPRIVVRYGTSAVESNFHGTTKPTRWATPCAMRRAARANRIRLVAATRAERFRAAKGRHLRVEGDFQHSIALMAEQLKGLRNVVQCEPVSDER